MTLAEILIRIGVDASRVASGVNQAERTLERLGTKLFYMGGRITAGVSAPIVLASRQIIKFGMDFDQAMTEAVAIMDDVTPQIRGKMESVAKAITETTKFSATEGAKAFYDLASAGLDSTGVIEGLPVVAKFAQAGLMDLATAGEYLAGAQAALGDSTASATQRVAEMARIGDVLTKANNIALGTVENFSAALTNKAGQQLRIFNKDVEEGVAVLTAYAQQNIKGANAGTQLYMALRDLARFATKNAEAFKANNIAVFDGAGNMRHMADIIGDFEARLEGATNKQAAFLFQQLGMTDRSRAATQALIGYSDAIRDADTKLREAGGTMDEVSKKQMESLRAQFQSLGNQFKVLVIDIFKEFEPVIRDSVIPAIQSLLGKGREFVEWLKTLSTETKGTILAVAGIASVIGPLMSFIGSWMLLTRVVTTPIVKVLEGFGLSAQAAGQAAGGAATNVGLLTRGWGAFVGAIRAVATPLGGLVAVFGLVIYGIKELAGSWTNFYKLIEPGAGILLPLRIGFEVLKDVWDRMNPTLYEFGRLSKEVFLYLGGAAVDAVRGLVNWLDRVVDKGVQLSKDYASGVTWFVKNIASFIPGASEGLEFFLDMWDRIGKAIGKAADEMARIREARENPYGAKDEWIPGRGKDIQLGVDLVPQQKGGPRLDFGKDFDLPKDQFGLLDLSEKFDGKKVRNLPKFDPNDLEDGGGSKPATIIARYKAQMKDLEAAMRSAYEENVPVQIIMEEFGDELESAARKSKIFGDELQTNTRKAYDAVRAFEMGTWMKEQAGKTAVATKEILAAIGLQMKPPDPNESMKAFMAIEEKIKEGHQRIQDMRLHGTAAEIVQIERKRKAEQDAVTAAVGQTAEQVAQQRKLIDEYYDHQTKKAKTTQDTLVERLREAGVKTKGELGQMATAAQKTFEQMKTHNETAAEGMKYSAEQVADAWKKAYDAMRAGAEKNPVLETMKEIHKNVTPLVEAFKSLSEVAGEDGFGAFAQGVGELLTQFDLAVQAGIKVQDAIMGIQEAMKMASDGVAGSGGKMVESLIGLASGIISGVSGMMAATSSGPMGQKVLGGAMSGAALGSSVGAGLAAAGVIGSATAKGMAVAGVWGAAAGAIVGIFIAVFRGAGTRRLMKKVGEEWGQDISEGLAKTIEKDAKKLFNGDDVSAALFHMKDIISEAGGVNADNLDKFTGKLHDVFSALETGMFTSTQAEKVLSENFDSIAGAVLRTGEVASKEFAHIIQLTKEWGLNVAEINEFLISQTGRFGTAMEQLTTYTARNFTGLAEEIKGVRDEIEKMNKEGADTAEIEKAQERLAVLLALQKHHAAEAAGSLERMAFLMLSGFNASIASGANVLQAIDQMGTAIDTLAQAYIDLGVSSENYAVQQLLAIGALRRENPELLAGIGALSEGMLALSMIGGLNVETFNAMLEQGNIMYTDLQAQAEKLGLDQSLAIGMMVPFLKAVLSASEEYGFSIDENTQKLIDQAKEMGLIKEDQIDTNDILMQGFTAMIEALGGQVPEAFRAAAEAGREAFSGVADEAQAAVDAAESAFQNFDPGTLTIPYMFEQHGGGPEVSGTDLDVPHLAAGGIVKQATLAVVGERGPEVVAPLNSMNWLHKNQQDSGDTYIMMDGRKVGKLVTKRQPSYLRNKGVRK